jgi:hypothetical protein
MKRRRSFLYLKVADLTVNMMLVWEEEEVQKPIYYISKVLHDAKTKYMKVEKCHPNFGKCNKKTESILSGTSSDRVNRPIHSKYSL